MTKATIVRRSFVLCPCCGAGIPIGDIEAALIEETAGYRSPMPATPIVITAKPLKPEAERLDAKHNHRPALQCEFCSFMGSTAQGLAVHKARIHKDLVEEDEPDPELDPLIARKRKFEEGLAK